MSHVPMFPSAIHDGVLVLQADNAVCLSPAQEVAKVLLAAGAQPKHAKVWISSAQGEKRTQLIALFKQHGHDLTKK